MITKFLYQMNVVNKRILTGLVENDVEAPYDPLREIPMVKEGEYKLLEGERVVSNFGEQFYGVFKEGKEYRYININDYMLKVKVDATDKVAFASSLSKDMIDSILDNTNYLGCDFDFNYVKSGFKLGEDKEFDDSFKRTFKPCQLYHSYGDPDRVSISDRMQVSARNSKCRADYFFFFKSCIRIAGLFHEGAPCLFKVSDVIRMMDYAHLVRFIVINCSVIVAHSLFSC